MIRILLLSLLAFPNALFGQISVKGSVKLDSTWSRTIYANSVASFHDMYKSSDQLIIAEADIDDAGNWELTIPGQRFPQIIRLHVSKKSDPMSSLIIGGQDENHGFLAIQNRDLSLRADHQTTGLFSHFSTNDTLLNAKMLEVQMLSDKWERIYGVTRSPKEKESIRKAAAQELLEYAETSSFILASIYAAHLADMGFNREEVYNSIRLTKKRLGDHPYIEVYPITPDKSFSELLPFFIIGFVLLTGMAVKVVMVYQNRKKRLLFNSLSSRERNVLELVKSGRSNKEIAMALNIEVSTVKSHVNSIFSKLKITSRSSLQDI